MQNKKTVIISLLILFFIANRLYAQQAGSHAEVIKPLKPAEIYYPQKNRIKVSKIDLNKASLEDLMLLPNVNEDIALKIIQRRPINSIEDLYRLPYTDESRIRILTEDLTKYVSQPLTIQEELKQ